MLGTPSKKLFVIYTSGLCAAAIAVVVLASLTQTDGVLIYALDDPYIHLSVAESIIEGHYGINSGEYASPSSSILYPYVLALGLLIGLGTYGPFLVSAVFSLVSVWITACFATRLLSLKSNLLSWLTFAILGIVLVMGLNAAGLPMTGMEHSIHVFGVVLTLTSLYNMLVEDRSDQLWLVILGCLICATIRFEGVALVFGVAVALFFAGHRRGVLVLSLLTGAVLLAYSSYMVRLGLPVFPSSVMTKSSVASEASGGSAWSLITSVLENAFYSLGTDRGFVLGIVAAALAAFSIDVRNPKGLRLFCAAVTIMLFGHVLGGRYGWFSRYEIYAVAGMIFGLIAVFGHNQYLRSKHTLTLAVCLLVFSTPYAWTTLLTPAASANIYQQQYQMHRFTSAYFPAPVAVNDLGWVAYKNDNYVLDLWGLGSEESRKLTAQGGWTQKKLSDITRRKEIEYAMIYDAWFNQVPDEWCRAGQLVTSKVTTAYDTVAFYLIETDQSTEFLEALRAFQDGLPAGARLELGTCPS
ncbi:MAG: hypothetical protein AAGL99_10670 [Pseudomonadota bacterium]